MIVIQWRLFVLAKSGERKHLLRIESRLMNQERAMTYLLSQKKTTYRFKPHVTVIIYQIYFNDT